MTTDTVSKRLFVGGLSHDVSEEEIRERFARFGKISDISLKHRKDTEGVLHKSFAHLNIEGNESNIKKCFDAFQNAKWKGCVLKLQYAKESFLTKLSKEREEVTSSEDISVTESPKVTSTWEPPQFDKPKGPAVPGTPIPGKSDWIVGKYGRVLPVLKLKKSSQLRVVKHDPSKLCHTAKVFKEAGSDPPETASCQTLTWEIDVPDSEIVKKMKGQFPPSKPLKRKPSQVPVEFTPNKKIPRNNVSKIDSIQRTLVDLANGVEIDSKRLKKPDVHAEDELEVVPIFKDSKKPNVYEQQKSNKFDSDIESDSDAKQIATRSPVSDSKNSKKQKDATKKQKKRKSDTLNEKRNLSQTLESPSQTLHESNIVSGHESETLEENLEDELVTSVDNLDNTSKERSSPRRKKSKKKEIFDPVPKFGGLSMLSCSSDSEQVKADSNVSAVTSSQLSQAVKNTSSPASESNLQSTPSLNMKEKVDVDYDSASSADTDEIIRRRRSKTSQETSSPGEFNSTSSDKTISNNMTLTTPVAKQNSSELDKGLLMSEFASAAPEIADNVKPSSEAASSKSPSDSNDSDLDSNDFELVAKKLAKKAGVSTSKASSKRSALDGSSLKKSKAPKKLLTESPTDQTSKEQEYSQAIDGLLKDYQKTETKKDVSPANKKMTDNEKRLQALKEQKKLKQQQQEMMKKALTNIDSQDSSKRKVFSSDDDDDEKESDQSGDDDDDDDDDDEINEGNKDKKKSKSSETKEAKSNMELFADSSDSDEEGSDPADMFKSRPHLEGKKGEKLMKLERKIGDSRFKLDAKFVESDTDDTEPEEEKGEGETDTLVAERDANLKVLEKVVGKATLDKFSHKIKKNTKQMVDMNTVRFDPTKLSTIPVENDINQRRFDPMAGTRQIATAEAKATSLKQKKQASSELDKSVEKMQSVKDDSISERNQILKQSETKESKSSDICEETDTSHIDQKDGSVSKKDKKVKFAEKTSSTEVTSKSKAVVSSSLADLFKKKNDKETEGEFGGFSLLDQFDTAEPDGDNSQGKNEKQRSGSDNVTPLSSLFKPTTKGPEVSKVVDDSSDDSDDEAMNESDELQEQDSKDDSKVDESSSDDEGSDNEDSSDDDDSDEDPVNDSQEDVQPISQVEKTTLKQVRKDLEDKSEESDESEEEPDADEPEVEDDEDIGAELRNAGRVDIRYSKDKWLERWNEIRPVLVKIYKRKHKDAVKNKKVQSEMKRRKEFSKNSKKNSWFRRKR